MQSYAIKPTQKVGFNIFLRFYCKVKYKQMNVTKYALIYFLDPDPITQDLQKISEMNIRRFFIGEASLFIFSTTMLIEELYEFLENVPEEGRLFFLMEYDERLKISLPKRILNFLESDEPIEDDRTYGIIFQDENDISELAEIGALEGVFDLNSEEITAKEYIASLSQDEQDSLYESILNKLPNISDWEAELLQELEL